MLMKISGGLRLEWIKSLKKILQDPLFPQGEQILKQTSKPARNSLLLHSRWGRFEEYLRFDKENHFLRTLGLVRYLISPSRGDRISGIRFLMQKLNKQDFGESGKKIFLSVMLKLMELAPDENAAAQKSELLTRMYDYYYRPVLAENQADDWLESVPVQRVAYENFNQKIFSPTTLLMYFYICGGRHLICIAKDKQLDELYKAGRVLGIEIHPFKNGQIQWSEKISNQERLSLVGQSQIHLHSIADEQNYFSKSVQETFHLKNFASPLAGMWQGLRYHMKIMDFRVKAPLQTAVALGVGSLTIWGWEIFWNRPGGFLTGLGFTTIWLIFSASASAASDVLTKHSWKEVFVKVSEVLDDIKKRKAVDNLFFSGISIVPLYTLQNALEWGFKPLLSPVAYLGLVFVGMSLANGIWSKLQRWWRGYFSKGVSNRDFFRGFFGYGLAGVSFYFWPEMGLVGFAIFSKFFKDFWSAVSEIIPGRKEKIHERFNDLREILKDRNNERFNRDIQKILQEHSVRIEKIGLNPDSKELPKLLRDTVIALHFLYLNTGLSLGDDAIGFFKRISGFPDEQLILERKLKRSLELLNQPDLIKKLLKVIFFSRELNEKAERFYEEHYREFVAKYLPQPVGPGLISRFAKWLFPLRPWR